MENQRHSCVNLEKKQRQFDKQLQEERLIATTRAEERDQSQARERAAESKAFSLQREIEELTDRTETLERQLRAKEAEISELESCQDKVRSLTISRFLERILMEHIRMKNSLDSELQI